MPLASAGETIILNALLSGVYISLHIGNPGNSGANEVSGGSYARKAATFTKSGSNPTVAANDAVVQFNQATADWGNVTHFGIWSAASGGSLLGYNPVTTAKIIAIGDVARWDIGTLTVSAD